MPLTVAYLIVGQSHSDSRTPWTVAHWLLCLWDLPDKNTGVGFHFPLQLIFPTQGSNNVSFTDRQTLYHLGSPAVYLLCVLSKYGSLEMNTFVNNVIAD